MHTSKSRIIGISLILLIGGIASTGCLKAEDTKKPIENIENEIFEISEEKKTIPSMIYTFNIGDESVSIIDGSANLVTDSRPVGFRSKWPAYQYSDGEVLWTVDDGTNNVTVVNMTNFEVLSSISVGNLPLTVELTPDGKFAYVSVQMDDEVAVIDTSSFEIIKKIKIPKKSNMSISHPCDTVITPDGKWVYVPSEWADSLSIISTDTNEVVKTMPTGKRPWKAAISPDSKYVFLVNMDDDTVSIIDADVQEEIKKIDVESKPYTAKFTMDGRFAYIANIGNDSVSVIDVSLLEVVSTIRVGKKPAYIAFSPDGALSYISNSGDNTVAVIDISQHEVIDVMPVGKKPRGVVVKTM